MSAIFESRQLAGSVADKLKVYAQPQRLMILSCLLVGEKTVGEIDLATQIGQPALSQQLAQLRQAELVKTRKLAKQVYYELADETIHLCVHTMETVFGGTMGQVLPQNAPTSSKASILGAARFARIE